MNNEWVLLVIGFVLGIGGSLCASIRIARLQFKASSAQYRVNMVMRATKDVRREIENGFHVGPQRNKYRYSLGVIIDALAKGFDCNGWQDNGPWPLLFPPPDNNNNGNPDRWEHFDRYVRPVLNDINDFSFLAKYGDRKIDYLTRLCHELENVVGELDAAWEAGLIRKDRDDVLRGISPENNSDVNTLRQAYSELYKVWCEWVQIVEP